MKNLMPIAAVVLLVVVVGLLIWMMRPGGRDLTPSEQRITFVVDQLERICLSGYSRATKDLVEAGVRGTLISGGAKAAATQADEVGRGAVKSLPAELQVAEGEKIRGCMTANFPIVLAAYDTPPQRAATGPVTAAVDKTIARPPAAESAPAEPTGEASPASEHQQPEPEAMAADLPPSACKRISPLRSLGYTGGHKTNFCRDRGYDGMTNFPDSDYKDHGGGFCYSGNDKACLVVAATGG